MVRLLEGAIKVPRVQIMIDARRRLPEEFRGVSNFTTRVEWDTAHVWDKELIDRATEAIVLKKDNLKADIQELKGDDDKKKEHADAIQNLKDLEEAGKAWDLVIKNKTELASIVISFMRYGRQINLQCPIPWNEAARFVYGGSNPLKAQWILEGHIDPTPLKVGVPEVEGEYINRRIQEIRQEGRSPTKYDAEMVRKEYAVRKRRKNWVSYAWYPILPPSQSDISNLERSRGMSVASQALVETFGKRVAKTVSLENQLKTTHSYVEGLEGEIHSLSDQVLGSKIDSMLADTESKIKTSAATMTSSVTQPEIRGKPARAGGTRINISLGNFSNFIKIIFRTILLFVGVVILLWGLVVYVTTNPPDFQILVLGTIWTGAGAMIYMFSGARQEESIQQPPPQQPPGSEGPKP